MSLMTKSAAVMLATTAMLAPAGVAHAQGYEGGQARATVSLNVRSGPGTGNRVVDTLQPGERVSVGECRSGWCYVEHPGPDGWASSRYLSAASGGSNRGASASASFDGGGYARATVALNVRSGPGTGNRIVGSLYEGQQVEVGECRGGWCRISTDRGTGWVSNRYLNRSGGGSGSANQDTGAGVSISAPGFSFSIGTGGNIDWNVGRSDRGGEVCFFEDFNYGGSSFCAEPGDRDADLGQFNDRISSIRVSGNAEVQVCEDYGFSGRCAVVSASRPRIDGRNNDIISSYRVR